MNNNVTNLSIKQYDHQILSFTSAGLLCEVAMAASTPLSTKMPPHPVTYSNT